MFFNFFITFNNAFFVYLAEYFAFMKQDNQRKQTKQNTK